MLFRDNETAHSTPPPGDGDPRDYCLQKGRNSLVIEPSTVVKFSTGLGIRNTPLYENQFRYFCRHVRFSASCTPIKETNPSRSAPLDLSRTKVSVLTMVPISLSTRACEEAATTPTLLSVRIAYRNVIGPTLTSPFALNLEVST